MIALIKVIALLSPFLFYFVTWVHYLAKDKNEFYEREGLKTRKERFGKYYHYVGSRHTWSKALDPYRGLAPSYIKKTLFVLLIIAIAIQFIPS